MRRWKPFACWVCLVLALLLVAVATVEVWQAHRYRRTAQNAADAAAVAGLWALWQYAEDAQAMSDAQIKAEMVDFAERTVRPVHPDQPYTDGALVNVIGIYVDAEGNTLGQVGASSPEGAKGIRAVVYVRVPTVLVRLVGLDAWSLEAVMTAYSIHVVPERPYTP